MTTNPAGSVAELGGVSGVPRWRLLYISCHLGCVIAAPPPLYGAPAHYSVPRSNPMESERGRCTPTPSLGCEDWVRWVRLEVHSCICLGRHRIYVLLLHLPSRRPFLRLLCPPIIPTSTQPRLNERAKKWYCAGRHATTKNTHWEISSGTSSSSIECSSCAMSCREEQRTRSKTINES